MGRFGALMVPGVACYASARIRPTMRPACPPLELPPVRTPPRENSRALSQSALSVTLSYLHGIPFPAPFTPLPVRPWPPTPPWLNLPRAPIEPPLTFRRCRERARGYLRAPWGRLGPLAPSWVPLGPPWGSLGPSWRALEPSGVGVGGDGGYGVCGSWAVL